MIHWTGREAPSKAKSHVSPSRRERRRVFLQGRTNVGLIIMIRIRTGVCYVSQKRRRVFLQVRTNEGYAVMTRIRSV